MNPSGAERGWPRVAGGGVDLFRNAPPPPLRQGCTVRLFPPPAYPSAQAAEIDSGRMKRQAGNLGRIMCLSSSSALCLSCGRFGTVEIMRSAGNSQKSGRNSCHWWVSGGSSEAFTLRDGGTVNGLNNSWSQKNLAFFNSAKHKKHRNFGKFSKNLVRWTLAC